MTDPRPRHTDHFTFGPANTDCRLTIFQLEVCMAASRRGEWDQRCKDALISTLCNGRIIPDAAKSCGVDEAWLAGATAMLRELDTKFRKAYCGGV